MIAVEDVSVRFGGVRALDGVSFTVPRGQTCGLIGPNGAGKTTLFDVVTGLRRPTTGTVRLADRDLAAAGAVARARLGLRRTFQRPQVFGRLTVLDNVVAALEWRGGGGGLPADLFGLRRRRGLERDRRARALATLERCGIADLSGAYAADLPMGQRRMVELARAIADDPAVLLLDEPTSGLDADQSARFADVVRRLSADDGTTILLVEHDVGFVMSACDRVLVLDLGKLIADDPPATLPTNPRVRSAYLG